jgi:hypothetical protein
MDLKIKMIYNSIYLYNRIAQIQYTDYIKCWTGCGGISFIAGENAKWYNNFGKQHGTFLPTKYTPTI